MSRYFPKRCSLWLSVTCVAIILILSPISLLLIDAPVAHGESAGTYAEQQKQTFDSLKKGAILLQNHSYTRPVKPTVYLTFDDGPSENTPEVLDILKKNGIHATFFTLGNQAELHPDTVKRIVREGHSIGNHTYNHVYKQLYSDFQTYWDQTMHTEQILKGILGFAPTIIRAPGGTYTNYDAFYFHFLDQAGYTVYDWNIDSGDSKRADVTAEEMVATVRNGPFPHEVTILMHDGTGHGQTVKALPQIIQIFKNRGYSFAPITEKVRPIMFPVGMQAFKRGMTYEHYQQIESEIAKKLDEGIQLLTITHSRFNQSQDSESLLREINQWITPQLELDSQGFVSVHYGNLTIKYYLIHKLLP